MLRNSILVFLMLYSCTSFASTENSKYFVFIGEKISLTGVLPKKGESPFDNKFLAKYRVIKTVMGAYKGREIEFTVFDHYGTPSFSQYKHVLLYVELHDGKYYHSKYQYSPLYKTKTEEWAGTYDAYDYNHAYNKDTDIKPEIIEFSEPITVDISGYGQEDRAKWFPEPYYKIEGNKATAIYGNYIKELFLLKQNGVLKARGEFQ